MRLPEIVLNDVLGKDWQVVMNDAVDTVQHSHDEGLSRVLAAVKSYRPRARWPRLLVIPVTALVLGMWPGAATGMVSESQIVMEVLPSPLDSVFSLGGGDWPALYPASEIDWRALVHRYDGWNEETMVKIVWCESRNHPNAVSEPNDDGLRDYGGFQHHGDPEGVNPEYATWQAYEKWLTRGYQPWVGSESCWR